MLRAKKETIKDKRWRRRYQWVFLMLWIASKRFK